MVAAVLPDESLPGSNTTAPVTSSDAEAARAEKTIPSTRLAAPAEAVAMPAIRSVRPGSNAGCAGVLVTVTADAADAGGGITGGFVAGELGAGASGAGVTEVPAGAGFEAAAGGGDPGGVPATTSVGGRALTSRCCRITSS